MNKQQAIEKVKEHGEFYSNAFGGTVKMVPVGHIIDIISQIDEPQKVTVPKFIAEWIDGCKRSGWHLERVLYSLDDDEKVGDWAYDENDDLISEKVDMIARAWLFGYKVEQEKLYTVEIPNPNIIGNEHTVLMKSIFNQIVIRRVYGDNWKTDIGYRLTESEIKQDFVFLWQFAKEVE